MSEKGWGIAVTVLTITLVGGWYVWRLQRTDQAVQKVKQAEAKLPEKPPPVDEARGKVEDSLRKSGRFPDVTVSVEERQLADSFLTGDGRRFKRVVMKGRVSTEKELVELKRAVAAAYPASVVWEVKVGR